MLAGHRVKSTIGGDQKIFEFGHLSPPNKVSAVARQFCNKIRVDPIEFESFSSFVKDYLETHLVPAFKDAYDPTASQVFSYVDDANRSFAWKVMYGTAIWRTFYYTPNSFNTCFKHQNKTGEV